MHVGGNVERIEASLDVLERRFDRPGFHRLSLTVENGALADLAWREVLVVQPVAQELAQRIETMAHVRVGEFSLDPSRCPAVLDTTTWAVAPLR